MSHRPVVRFPLATVASAILLLAGTLVSSAHAQDMTFGMTETGQTAAPPSEGPPSEALVNALRLYQQKRYRESSVQFQRVVEGQTSDAQGNRQKAQFFLGKALYHLGYYQSALRLFDEISTTGKGHLFFDQTLEWLSQLASQLPEPAGIIDMVGRYRTEQIEQFNNARQRQFYNQLLYYLGRSRYSNGEFEQAIDLFKQVSDSSQYYAHARMFEGISQIRMRQARPAITAFRSILEALDSGELEVDEEERMRDLAWISLARVYYTAANKVDETSGDRDVDGKLLGAAVDAWSRIGVGSEYWLDSLFESSFALFLADKYARATGNIHTLFSPYFDSSYYPEALVLKSVIFYMNCQMDNAQAMVTRFHDRYDPVQDELGGKLAEFEDSDTFYKFLNDVLEGRAQLSQNIRGVVSTALTDRTVLRHIEYVRVLEKEESQLAKSPLAFKNSSVGDRILQDVALAKSMAVEAAGELAKGRYDRIVEELQDFQNQIGTVELEILTYQRGQMSQEMQEQQVTAARSGGGVVNVDEEHQVWPFDGEYWRDELGFYRQQVTSQCGR